MPAVIWTVTASAAGYPDRPLRYVMGSAVGGGPDIAARVVMNQLSRQLGQQIIVDNRAGASGIIGTDVIAKAQPDGYTLGHGNILTMAIGPSVHLKLPYDPVKSFQPVVHMYGTPNLLAVTLSLPVNSVSQLVAYAKANPGKLSYGSAGAGGANHLAGEMFKHVAGIDMVHVPYKGNGPAIIDLIGGQIGVMIGSISSLYPHAAAKKLRLLAVASATRSAAAPEIPTFAEGGVPGYRVNGWNCLVAPRATPQAVIKRLNAEIVAGFSQPDVVERLRKQSIDPAAGTPDQLAAYMKSEIARYHQLIKAVGLKAE